MSSATARWKILRISILVAIAIGSVGVYVLLNGWRAANTTSPLPTALTSTIRTETVGTAVSQRPEREPYLLVGGQNGTWFQDGQFPRLCKLSLHDYSLVQMTPSKDQGTVWTGGWNGSQWLISGWGVDDEPYRSNPYIYLYDGDRQVAGSSPSLYEDETPWRGGDIFAVSYNGQQWLLSGLGSGSLHGNLPASNHMALATFDGHNFTDLSDEIPGQWDAMLYANAWNGQYWLVGGGWEGMEGTLFRYDGRNFTDLSSQLDSALPQFDAVQAIQWNGHYWLIGGVGFLAKYDGRVFTDLTPKLKAALGPRQRIGYTYCCNAVNSVAWDGARWMIGGGSPVAVTEPLTAWAVSFDGEKFTDLSSLIPSYVTNSTKGSSILSVAYVGGAWFFGGYANGRGVLLSYTDSAMTDLSYLVSSDMSTVNWVGGWADGTYANLTHQLGAGSYPGSHIAPENPVAIPMDAILIDSTLLRLQEYHGGGFS